MALNSISPTTFESGVLIADTTNISGGARGVINENITPSTALDIQSTKGAVALPRMNTLDKLALDKSNGMVIYDTTLDQFQFCQEDSWIGIDTSTGNVVGPSSSITNNIPVFADTTGKLLSDSGVNITAVPLNLFGGPLVTELQLGNVDIISYNDVGLIYTGGDFVVGFHPNSLAGRPPNTVFGFSNPSSPDANVEITQGALLLSRLSQTDINGLISVDGMMVYNEDTEAFNFYQNGSWVNPITGADPAAKYILQTANPSLPNAQSLGALTTGLILNTVTGSTGVLSKATAGTDYYAPGFPTTIRDSGGSGNLFIGTNAGSGSVLGPQNLGVGTAALQSLTFGGSNVGLGFNALNLVTTTSNNVAIGHNAASTHTGYDRCIFIGANTDTSLDNITNSIVIGHGAIAALSDMLILGNGNQNIVINNSSGSYDFNLFNSQTGTSFLYIANTVATTPVPPATGGGVLYTNGGRLFYVSENGTITQLAPA